MKQVDLEGPEVRLQEDDDMEEPDKNMRRRDLQGERRSASPFTVLREDFSQFKDEVLKVFKDKDMKTEVEDHLQSPKPASRTLSLLREELNQFKEDVTSVFSVTSSKDKKTKPAEKPLKEDLSNAFRPSKEDTSNIFSSRADRTDNLLQSLFRRDQKVFQKVQETFSETSEEQVDGGFRNEVEKIPASQPGRFHPIKTHVGADGEHSVSIGLETSAELHSAGPGS